MSNACADLIFCGNRQLLNRNFTRKRDWLSGQYPG